MTGMNNGFKSSYDTPGMQDGAGRSERARLVSAEERLNEVFAEVERLNAGNPLRDYAFHSFDYKPANPIAIMGEIVYTERETPKRSLPEGLDLPEVR